MTNVSDEVIALIAKKIRPPRPSVQLTDRLEDLGLESIGTVELIFDLEEKFDIQIPYNANDSALEYETVGDVVRAIQGLVDKARA